MTLEHARYRNLRTAALRSADAVTVHLCNMVPDDVKLLNVIDALLVWLSEQKSDRVSTVCADARGNVKLTSPVTHRWLTAVRLIGSSEVNCSVLKVKGASILRGRRHEKPMSPLSHRDTPHSVSELSEGYHASRQSEWKFRMPERHFCSLRATLAQWRFSFVKIQISPRWPAARSTRAHGSA